MDGSEGKGRDTRLRVAARNATPRDVLLAVFSNILLVGTLFRLDRLLPVMVVGAVALKVARVIDWGWVLVLIPLWLSIGLYLAWRSLMWILEGILGSEGTRNVSVDMSIVGVPIVSLALLPALKVFGVLEWSWLWVLSPLWIGLGVEIAALAAFAASLVVVGSHKTMDLLDKAILVGSFAGVGAIATLVIAVLKQGGMVSWSWAVVVAPLAANIALSVAFFGMGLLYVNFVVAPWMRR